MLPSDLLLAISKESGGQVVVVTGAGCSHEPPTNLPLTKECARVAHQRLIDDGVLSLGDCTNPDDLSDLAEVVFTKTGHQVELVKRFPLERFQRAAPNEGYLLAAALLREGALQSLLTLNFDLAIFSALVSLGSVDDVAIVKGPHEYQSWDWSMLSSFTGERIALRMTGFFADRSSIKIGRIPGSRSSAPRFSAARLLYSRD